jgi:hypothetical protein
MKNVKNTEHNVMTDNVNHPPHYKQGEIECIDAIKSCLGDGFKFYLQGNAMKYLWRYEHKGKAIEDLEKAIWYINRLKEQYE